MSDDMVDIDFDEIVHETELAWLLDLGDEQQWFPKSHCDIDERDNIVSVPEWLAEERGLV